MSSTESVPFRQVTSADWILMDESIADLFVTAFDDVEQDKYFVNISNMASVMHFQYPFTDPDDLHEILELREPELVSNNNSSNNETTCRLPFLFSDDLITPPGSAATSMDALYQYGLLSQSSNTCNESLRSSLLGVSPSTFRSSTLTPFQLSNVKLPNKPTVSKSEIVKEENILESDILCGRGGKSNNHDGNKQYRHSIRKHRQQYRDTSAKKVKTAISLSIVKDVNCCGGRFLKRIKLGQWVALSRTEAQRKVAQALRETKTLIWIK